MNHGTPSCYSAGCRLPVCIKAHTRQMKEYRLGRYRLVDATGSKRRLQGLAWMGYRRMDIVNATGINLQVLSDIMTQDKVSAKRAVAIRKVFGELHMKPGPSRQVAGEARAKGWASPLAWDEDEIDDPTVRPNTGIEDGTIDEVVVGRLVGGERVKANRHERNAALAILCPGDLSDARIAERLGCAERTVERFRKATQ